MSKSLFNKIISYFKEREIEFSADEIDVSWRQLIRRIENKRLRLKRLRIVSIVAASVMILLGFFYFVHDGQNSAKTMLVEAQIADTDDIMLVTSSGQVIKVGDGSTIEYSRNHISVDGSEVVNLSAHEENGQERLYVPDGRTAKLVMADGTSMFVNAGTNVSFPQRFKPGKREISVNGEVFLDVFHDESAPFSVNTPRFSVSVLGTAFNVNAYDGSMNRQEVVLLRGKVEVVSKSGEKIQLQPDEKVSISHKGKISSEKVNAEEYILWTQGILFMNTSTISSILERLSHHYGVNISYTDDIADIEIEGKLDLKCGVWDALNRIANTGGFNLLRETGGYKLTSR